jgi:hypothetical protein
MKQIILLILIVMAPVVSFALCESSKEMDNLRYHKDRLNALWGQSKLAKDTAEANLNNLKLEIEGYPLAVKTAAANVESNIRTIALLNQAMESVEQSLVNAASLKITLADIMQMSSENPDVPISRILRQLARKNNSVDPQIQQVANAVESLEQKFADWKQTELEVLQKFSQDQDAGQILLDLVHSGIERLEFDSSQLKDAFNSASARLNELNAQINAQIQIIQTNGAEMARLSAEGDRTEQAFQGAAYSNNFLCGQQERRERFSHAY